MTRLSPMAEEDPMPFSEHEKYVMVFRMMQQVGETIANSIANSDLTSSEVDRICSFKKGTTSRVLVKCLDWDGKWEGPSLRILALIVRACGFRLDFSIVEDNSRPAPLEKYDPFIEPRVQSPPAEEPVDPKNPPVTL